MSGRKPAQWNWNYGYYNDRECFPVFGPGIDESRDGDLMKFANPQLAERMCRILQHVYEHGAADAQTKARNAIGVE